jgi:hypothetical protein
MPILAALAALLLLILVAAWWGVKVATLLKLLLGLLALLGLLWLLLRNTISNGFRTAHVAKLLQLISRMRAGLLPDPITSAPREPDDAFAALRAFFDEWCRDRLTASEVETLLTLLNKLLIEFPPIADAWPEKDPRRAELDGFLERIRALLNKLSADLETWKRLKAGLDLLKSPAGLTDEERDRIYRDALTLAERYRGASGEKLLSLEESAEEFRLAYAGRPRRVFSPGRQNEEDPADGECVQEGVLSSVIFGGGAGFVLRPGCCVIVEFSPRLSDQWRKDDLAITSDGDASLAVSALPHRQNLTDASAVWEPLLRAAPGRYEFDGLFDNFRYVRICNTGASPVTITAVRQP